MSACAKSNRGGDCMGTLATRIGGAFGILAVLVMIPAFVVGTPDKPRTPDEARHYYDSGSTIVTANVIVPLLHTWIPLAAAISTLAWVGLIGLVMLVAAKSTTPAAIEARAVGES